MSASKSRGRGASAGGGGDAARLRQQLVHAKTEIADLQEELQEQTNLYLNAIKEKDAGAEALRTAKESLARLSATVKAAVDRALEEERKVHKRGELRVLAH